jgi:4-oxalocrotonate tautomerase
VPFISVELMAGRTIDQRRKFARLVTDAAVAALDTTPDKVRIVFHELAPEDLARAGTLTSDPDPA